MIIKKMGKEEISTSVITTPIVSIANEVVFINADKSGIFVTEVKNNIIIDEGEEIGIIVNPLSGEILQKVIAPVPGLLFTIRAYPVVYQGSLLARIHHL